MPAASTSRRTSASSLGRRRRSRTPHDRVGRPEHAKERPAAAAIVRRPFEQPRDLDQLDGHALDPGQRRDRSQGRERIVAGPDGDRRERLEDRRLADVGRADERDLGRALPAHGDRVTVHGSRADLRRVDLGEQRLAQVRVWPVAVVRQLCQERPYLADPLPTFLAHEAAPSHLGERAMRHRHRHTPSRCGGTARRRPPARWPQRHASRSAPSHRR